MSCLRLSIAALGAGLLVACAEPSPDGAGEPLAAEARIVASAGGTVASADGAVRLTVPAESLPADTTIAIHQVDELPAGGDLGDLRPAGQAYRFTPEGTQFSLAEAAGMVMRFDRERLVAEGLDPRTVQLHYYDEDTGRYVAIAGRVEPDRDEVFGRTEHFTIYLPLARALLPGNNPPSIALQNTIPATARAGAPLAVRATVRDVDAAGSVTGVNLTYTVTGRAAKTVAMVPDATVGALDTYQYVIPAGDVIAGAGNDLTYVVSAADNVNATATSNVTTLDNVRTADLNTLAASPASQTMAAGFSRNFTWTMRDDQAASFTVLPDRVEVLGGIGDVIATGSGGVAFTAKKVGVGGLRGTIGASTATAQIGVMNGPLTALQILDTNGMPIDGVVSIREGDRYTFDAVGRDAFGNRVLVHPAWATDGDIGAVDGEGVLDTLDGVDIGRVKASVGNVATVQWVEIRRRFYGPLGDWIAGRVVGDRRALGEWNGAPLISEIVPLGLGGSPIASARQHRYDAAFDAWGQLFAVVPPVHATSQTVAGDSNYLAVADLFGDLILYQRQAGALSSFAVGGHVARSLPEVISVSVQVAPDGAPWVAYIAPDLATFVQRIRVKRWNGSAWILMGATANADPDLDARSCTLAFGADGTAYLASREDTGTFVKRWNGVDWVALGGALAAPEDGEVHPAIEVSSGGRLYVAYGRIPPGDPSRLRVASWSGAAWTDVAPEIELGGAAVPGAVLSLALVGELPYLAYVDTRFGTPTVRLLRPHRDRQAWVTQIFGPPSDELTPAAVTALDARPDGSLRIASGWVAEFDGSLDDALTTVYVLR